MDEKKHHSETAKKDEMIEINAGKSLEKVRKNPWIASTVVLALVLLGVLIFGRGAGTASSDEVGQNVISYIESNPDLAGQVSLVSAEKEGQFYVVTLNYQGQDVPVYTTLDGEYLVGNPVQIDKEDTDTTDTTDTTTPQPTTVTKSDKPVVEAFIFSYCPYGLQFEKALIPVYEQLKGKADFNIVAIGAMHGEYEHVETLRQISIEKLYSKDKLFAYLKEFNANTNIGACRGDDACLNKYLPAIYTKLGIDKTKVDNYMKTSAETIYKEQNARASQLGISGSPTFVINGAKVQVARSPAAIQKAVCDAFNTAPAECSTTLASTQASAGFGTSTSAASASTASC